ncbi:MAG: hypothetical protein V1916_01365, partial [Patescibacteria group bacterium]
DKIYQVGNDFIAVNKNSHIQLTQTGIENKKDRCTGVACTEYTMMWCADGNDSKYQGSCVNKICKKVSKN